MIFEAPSEASICDEYAGLNGHCMDRAWTLHGQDMDMLKKVDLKEFIWIFLANLVVITLIGGKGYLFYKKNVKCVSIRFSCALLELLQSR